MNILRTVRRSRALTLVELAHSTGLPARLIAEAEYGLRQLSDQEYAQLAVALELPVEALRPQPMAPVRQPPSRVSLLAHWTLLVGGVTVLLFLLGFGAIYTPSLWPWHTPAMAQEAGTMLTVALSATPIATATVTATPEPTPTATASPMPTVTATPEPTPTATPFVLNEPVQPAGVEQPIVAPTMVPPLFVLTEKGPLGCPLQPSQGHVVMTQGYGVGSHAPADVWGAVDLAVVDSTRGYKDITKYTPVAATHDGIVYVSLGSWPGGNHVSIVDPVTGWRTGYAHLAYVFLESGTAVTAGNYIGLAGDTGHATGPHLDYQVWYGDTNIDPTGLVQGCR